MSRAEVFYGNIVASHSCTDAAQLSNVNCSSSMYNMNGHSCGGGVSSMHALKMNVMRRNEAK